jgi:hypothetical protein
MTLPLYMKDLFGYPTGLVFAIVIGFGFGFALERSGFGRSTVLAAQFYFRDMRVFKVMFSAIVTALIGTTLLSGAGLLDLRAVQIPPTFLWPQLIGGLLLGAGFIVSGYCPGTSVVAIASGKIDGAAAAAGFMGGSLIFGFVHPSIEDFYVSGSMGIVRLPDLLGIPQALLALAVALLAIGGFAGAEKVERIFAKKDGTEATSSAPTVGRRVFAAFVTAAVLGLFTLLAPPNGDARAERSFATIDPIELARLAVEDPSSCFLVDLRSPAPPIGDRIPGALAIPEDDPEGSFLATLPPVRSLILYAEGDLTSLPPAAALFPGRVVVLDGGYASFRARILDPPALPENPDAASIATYRLVSALHAYFTGTERSATPPPAQPSAASRTGEKKGGGC